jgi:hypothetical protein
MEQLDWQIIALEDACLVSRHFYRDNKKEMTDR